MSLTRSLAVLALALTLLALAHPPSHAGDPSQDFNGTDGHDLMGVYVGAGGTTGTFELQIDDVRFD